MPVFLLEATGYGAWTYMGEGVDMGLRNYLGRAVLMLALALAVGIVVAIMGGEERARTVERGLSTIEHQGSMIRARA
jgi:hypothetical protein